jgi:UPF0042 nucleotide-binding protein
MKLVIVSGLSGSGKTVALHALEDAGYYCMDNLHIGLLTAVVRQFMAAGHGLYDQTAVGIDARSGTEALEHFSEIAREIRDLGVDLQILFLQAEEPTLLRRFSETRRRHPLTREDLPLVEAIQLERQLLAPVVEQADLAIDTTRTNVHQLSDTVRQRVEQAEASGLSVLIRSFGFKHGTPVDSDFVFDVRCLPNPHWEPRLRALTGLDPEVADFLGSHPLVEEMHVSLRDFLVTWIPRFERDNRSYLTVSIGCTGGQHRSVYLAERLAADLRALRGEAISTRHRELT